MAAKIDTTPIAATGATTDLRSVESAAHYSA
jgi:hypothetical protein